MCSYPGLHPRLVATGRMAGFYKRPLWFFPSPGRLCLCSWPWQTVSPCHSPGRTRWYSTKANTEQFISYLGKLYECCISVWLKFSSTQLYFSCCSDIELWACEHVSNLWLGLDILAEQPLLIQGVAGLSCDGVYGSLVDLLLDCTQQQEERLTHCLLKNVKGAVNSQSWAKYNLFSRSV